MTLEEFKKDVLDLQKKLQNYKYELWEILDYIYSMNGGNNIYWKHVSDLRKLSDQIDKHLLEIKKGLEKVSTPTTPKTEAYYIDYYSHLIHTHFKMDDDMWFDYQRRFPSELRQKILGKKW